MDEVRLVIVEAGGALDPEMTEALRLDLDREVGPARFGTAPAGEGAKGMEMMQMATLAVSLLGAPAVVALVGVLKSYFDRDRVTEVEVTGPRGTAKLKLPAGSRLSADDIQRAIAGVLAPT